MTKTPWFPASTPPVRKGLYECKFESYPKAGNLKRLWNGWEWLRPDGLLTEFGFMPGDKWRGLTHSHQKVTP